MSSSSGAARSNLSNYDLCCCVVVTCFMPLGFVVQHGCSLMLLCTHISTLTDAAGVVQSVSVLLMRHPKSVFPAVFH